MTKKTLKYIFNIFASIAASFSKNLKLKKSFNFFSDLIVIVEGR